VDYTGELFPDDSSKHTTSEYCLQYIENHAIDASRLGNESRFVNDFRGIAGKPNIQFAYKQGTDPYIIGYEVMNKPIQKGEELLTTYGKRYWIGRGKLADECTSDCPGRHGLVPLAVPKMSTFLCHVCVVELEYPAKYCYCKICNHVVCSGCNATSTSTALPCCAFQVCQIR